MKKIWEFLKHHFQQDFNKGHYATTAVMLAFFIGLNYHFRYSDDVLEPMAGFQKFFYYLVFYSFPYYLSIISYAFFNRKREIFFKNEFWIKSSLAICLLSLDSSLSFVYPLISKLSHHLVELWIMKVSINLLSVFTILIPILLFYKWYEPNARHVYGLNAKRFDVRPYFTMLLIMLPVIIGASFNEIFGRQYPMYKVSLAHVYLGVPEWVTVAIYEFAYGFDFVTVEYFFRGFLVIGMMSVLGRGAVLSMAVIYCVLHFGKPAGEAVSSIFGGYILGVVAFETRSVWGGIIVHIGLAWIMELVAFLQKLNHASYP
jgi:hypothetical protein